MVDITKIDTSDRKHVKRFIQITEDLYRPSPLWVPPIWPDAVMQLDRKRHPYYEHSDADFFVASRDGRDVGRIAVLENRRYNEHKHERTCFFYLYDSIEDQDVANALFGVAEEWARSRNLKQMIGPKGFIAMDAFGFLVEGFEYLPALGVPYNYPYYDHLMAGAGYRKYTDVYSCYFSSAEGRMDIDPRIYSVADRIQRKRGITVKKFRSKKELVAMVPDVVQAYNNTFIHNWEYVPVTEKEAKLIVSRLIDIARPELIKLIMLGDEIIGFLLGYPNVNEAIQKIRGRLWPFGFIHLLRAMKTSRRLDLNGVGILPHYQGSGAIAIMYAEMARTVKDHGYEFAELVQMEEKNEKIQAELKTLGAKFYKTHRIYVKELV